MKWNDKSGNIMNGKINKLNKVKAIIEDEQKNIYVLAYTSLFI